ncbi:MAG: ATP phosphoribosyltransferase, partial [Cutibacterium granulosum]|nr:ATP phosphoribosyltransferase [Cutibacterium granulosum]
MVGRGLVQSLMDDLWDAGARAIISTELSACRL